MLIVKCTAKDAPVIARMEKEYIECPWSEQTVRDSIENSLYEFFKAIVDGKTVGYIGVEWCLDEGNICNIAVESEMRRKGIAGALIDEVILSAKNRGARALFLEVNERNEGALALYKSKGFSVISTRKNYYGKNTAIVMSKSL